MVGVLAPGLTDRVQGEVTVPLSFKPEQMNHAFHHHGSPCLAGSGPVGLVHDALRTE